MKKIEIGMIVKLERLDDVIDSLTTVKKGDVAVVTDVTADGDFAVYIPRVNNSLAWILPGDVSVISDPLADYR